MSDAIALTGLRGDNPLAFLASLGALRVLSTARQDDPPRMAWAIERGAWRPVLHDLHGVDAQELPVTIEAAIRDMCGPEPFQFAKNTSIPPEDFAPSSGRPPIAPPPATAAALTSRPPSAARRSPIVRGKRRTPPCAR